MQLELKSEPKRSMDHAVECARRLGGRARALRDDTQAKCNECGNRATWCVVARGWRGGFAACERHAADVFGNARVAEVRA